MRPRPALLLALSVMAAAFVLTGCGRHHRAVTVRSEQYAARVPNLLIGADPDQARLAEAFARSDWPSTAVGYRTDTVTEYAVFGYEYQFDFDEHGGLYWGSEILETGARLR